MPISINNYSMFGVQLSYLVPHLVYFDKIHHVYKKNETFFLLPFFSNAQSDSFRGVGSHLCSILCRGK
jgi:hypothetical protein